MTVRLFLVALVLSTHGLEPRALSLQGSNFQLPINAVLLPGVPDGCDPVTQIDLPTPARLLGPDGQWFVCGDKGTGLTHTWQRWARCHDVPVGMPGSCR